MKLFRNIVCLLLVVTMAGGLVAEEKEKKGKRARRGPSVTQKYVAKLELSPEQKEQVAAIDQEFAGKVKELAEKRRAILTPEQQKARQDAMKAAKAAREEGKDAKEIRRELANAVQLTEAQQKQQKELQAAQQELNKQVLAALKTVLTPAQQEQLPKVRSGKGEKSNKGDRPKKRNKKKADA